MSAGYAFGVLYKRGETERRQLLFRLGAALALGFVVLRAINVYGDPVRWSTQASTMKTVFSFLALSKYPPSLLYLMMTLGPALVFLAWSERHTQSRLAKNSHHLRQGASLLLSAAVDRRSRIRDPGFATGGKADRLPVRQPVSFTAAACLDMGSACRSCMPCGSSG